MSEDINLIEALNHIDPVALDYSSWVQVGMALKEAGLTSDVWDSWSALDSRRYHPGECSRKWATFSGSYMGSPVTAGTIIKMAMDRGWRPKWEDDEDSTPGIALDWDAVIEPHKGDAAVVDRAWLESKEIHEPERWEPEKDLITYLSTLFDSSEHVGYVLESYTTPDGRKVPSKGNYDRTAGQLIDGLRTCKGDIGRVLGDYDPAVGGWIRFNPLDGEGVKDQNVTAFRYALVESDEMALEEQHAMICELELPVAALVSSGGKSLHAIVKIEATSFEEYRKRVDFLYSVCEQNGLKMDRQNRNPSRLSRLPGVTRNGHKQFLIGTNMGKGSWQEWRDWIDAVTDDLPDPESMAASWDNLPALAPPLIDGVLRQGHKMLLAGPSKAGKSYALIELCCAIAEGKDWLGFQCTQGKVMYVNLELDRASCLHRFRDVYEALEFSPANLANIDIWNLRGRSVPMDKLAPKLIRRAAKKNYIAIIIDPIYKVITGDENSADQMAHFCNQFDKVCTELGCAVIYCHHHSKGQQGGKRSMDRASGSGVFARDPDALLDVIELLITDGIREQYELTDDVTAWRIDGTLREFPKFQPVNLWFKYPVHEVDNTDVLEDVDPEADQPSWKKNFKNKRTPEERKKSRSGSIETAFDAVAVEGSATIKDLVEYTSKSADTVRRYLREHGGFWVEEGRVYRK